MVLFTVLIKTSLVANYRDFAYNLPSKHLLTTTMTSQLKRDISPLGLLFISFTAIFGSGWLFAPFFAAQIAGPAALVAWLLGAIMSMVIGITLAEVIILFPRVGGLNNVVQMSQGKMMGFIANVLMLIVFLILPAIEVRAIIQYLGSQSNLFINNSAVTGLGFLLAALLLVIINCVNVYGAKITERINSLSVVFKLIAPITICLVFLWVLHRSQHLNLNHLQPFNLDWQTIFLCISTSGIIFSYNGFNQATLFAAETKNPQKSIPFAIIGSIIFSGLMYLLIQWVFLLAVPTSAIANGWTALKFAGDSGPFSGLATLLGLHWLLYFIYADAIVSPLGTAFTYASAAPRLLYAFAENGKSFLWLQKLNRNGVPSYSIYLSLLLSFLAFVFLPSLKVMISILVAAFVLNYSLAPIALLTFRKTTPEKERLFKVPLAPLFCFLSLFFSDLMVFSCGFNALKNLCIVITVALLISIIFQLRQKELVSLKGIAWFIFQILVLTLLSYLTELKLISFLTAVSIIGGLCLFLIYITQQKTALITTHLRSLENP